MKRFREPDWIRTNDPQLRRLMLYPTELPVPIWKLWCSLPVGRYPTELSVPFFEIANVADFFKKNQENLDLKNTPFPFLLNRGMIGGIDTLRN